MDVPNDQTWVAAYFVKTHSEIIRVRGGECEGIARTGVPCRERHQGTASCMLGSVEARQVYSPVAEADRDEVIEHWVGGPCKTLLAARFGGGGWKGSSRRSARGCHVCGLTFIWFNSSCDATCLISELWGSLSYSVIWVLPPTMNLFCPRGCHMRRLSEGATIVETGDGRVLRVGLQTGYVVLLHSVLGGAIRHKLWFES